MTKLMYLYLTHVRDLGHDLLPMQYTEFTHLLRRLLTFLGIDNGYYLINIYVVMFRLCLVLAVSVSVVSVYLMPSVYFAHNFS